MIGLLQGEERKLHQKIQKKRSNVELVEQRKFHTKDAWAGAKFAHAWLVVRNSHMHGWLCEIRTCMVQLSSKGHIFLVLASNHTRFESLDF